MSWISELTGTDDRKHARDAYSKAGDLASQQAALAQEQLKRSQGYITQYQDPILGQAYKAATDYDPYAMDNYAPAYMQYKNANAGAYDDAVDQTYSDYAERGLGGASSGLGADISGIRRDEAQNFGNFRLGQYQNNINERQRRLENFVPMINGVVGNLQGQAGGNLNSGVGNMGGIGGMYSSQANQAMQNLTGLAQTAATYGMGGKAQPLSLPNMGNGNPNAGNNQLSTNQSGAPLPMNDYTQWGGAAGSAVGNPAAVPMLNNNYNRSRIRTGNGARA